MNARRCERCLQLNDRIIGLEEEVLSLEHDIEDLKADVRSAKRDDEFFDLISNLVDQGSFQEIKFLVEKRRFEMRR